MTSLYAKISQASSLFTSLKGLVTVPNHTVIHNVIIDCVHSEVIDYTNAITDHPISSKSSISDHVYSQPVIVNIEGTITDSNFKIFGMIEQPLQANSLQKILTNAKNLVGLNTQKPSEVAYKALTTLADEKAMFSVSTKYKTYHNMVIEKLSIKGDNTTVNRLLFNCTLKQLTLVKVANSFYTPNTPLKPVGKAVNKGPQQIIEQREIPQSEAAKMLDGAGNMTQKGKELLKKWLNAPDLGF